MIMDAASDAAQWRKHSITLLILALVLFSPMAFVQSYVLTKAMADFPTHLLWAQEIKNGVAIPSYVIAHSGWQVLLLLFNLIGFPLQLADFTAIILCEIVTVLILLQWFWPALTAKGMPLWETGLIILGVSVASPISALWFLDQKFYLGYIGITSYHNPTIILLRPLALLQFMGVPRCFEARPVSKLEITGMAIISALAAFAKPNFAICLIPAMCLRWIPQILQRKRSNLAAFSFGFILPTIGILAFQFLISYYNNDTDRISLAPFMVMGSYSKFLPSKFLLSIVFPLLVTIRYRAQAWQDVRMSLAWLIFIFGSFYTYFLAESGSRFFDGNFTWSGEIALFVLFAASTLFFVEFSETSDRWSRFLKGVWLCHVLVGITYFLYFLTVHIYV